MGFRINLFLILILLSSFANAEILQSDVRAWWEGENNYNNEVGIYSMSPQGTTTFNETAKIGSYSFDLRGSTSDYLSTNFKDFENSSTTISLWFYLVGNDPSGVNYFISTNESRFYYEWEQVQVGSSEWKFLSNDGSNIYQTTDLN